MRVSQFLTVVSIVAIGSPSFAASVVPGKGVPQVNSGSGFHSISGVTEVATGDQVMVPPGGFADIAYTETCLIRVNPGQVAVVDSASPCQETGAYGYYKAPIYKAPAAPVAEDNTGYYLLGGVGVVGVGVGIYELTKHHHHPASP